MSDTETIAIAGPGGASARVLTYGARLQRLDVPDREGRFDSVVLGFADPAAYARDTSFIGGVIGRYANRIAGGRFRLDGRLLVLPLNDGENHLHGGPDGFDRRDWTVLDSDARSVTLQHVSADGEAGYPGRLVANARYRFGDDDALTLDLCATTDAPTIVNLTHHAYFNLAGQRRGGRIGDHWLRIPASTFLPVDAGGIPTGAPRPVADTPFDFRAAHAIGARWDADDAQINQAGGYDHNYVLDSPAGEARPVATLFDPESGRVLDLAASAPGLQFYSGNALASIDPGMTGACYGPREGLCLEPQLFPDSPNRPHFPAARLNPGAVYHQRIVFAFRTAGSVEEAFA